MLTEQVRYVKDNPGVCRTLVIDTMDWAEQLAAAFVCSKAKKTSLEDFGYGKGYVFLSDEIGRLLASLDGLVELGINIVVTAHAKMRKFEQPDEMGSYDRWEMKLSKNVAPLVKEWADVVLFANYKTFSVAADDKGKKFKAQGGSRVMYTSHHPCWDAKNRHGLAEELPFDYQEIAANIPPLEPDAKPLPEPAKEPAAEEPAKEPFDPAEYEEIPVEEEPPEGVPKELATLMAKDKVTEQEVREAVCDRGYYPADTPIANYETEFVKEVLIKAWPQVLKMILDNRRLPF